MPPVAPPPDLADRLLVPATVGIRHFSPASARAVQATLEAVHPACILLEAPVDAAAGLVQLGADGNHPPIGWAVVDDASARRFLFPLTPWSPEWIVCRWAWRHGVRVVGIDLPVAQQLALETAFGATEHPTSPDPHARFAEHAGAPDFDVWWERAFEHHADVASYGRTIWELARGLRALTWPPHRVAEWQLREAFMRRRITEVLAEGVLPERCVVVCGALHAPALCHPSGDVRSSLPPLPIFDGARPEPRRPIPSAVSAPSPSLAPQPQAPHLPSMQAGPSFGWSPEASAPQLHPHAVILDAARLAASETSGGDCAAPAYLEQLAAAVETARPQEVAANFLAKVAWELRARGLEISPAEVIDAVRLSRQLASLADSPIVTLRDLRDAALTCFATDTSRDVLATAIEAAMRGDAEGRLAGGPLPPLAHELHRRFEALGLPIFGPGLQERFQLDLRPSPDPTATDRSKLLHRLEVLEIPGVHRVTAQGEKALEGWREAWELAWTPRSWEGLFVAGRKGVTLEEAATLHLQEVLMRARSVTAQVRLLLKANAAGLFGVLEAAAQRLEETSLDAASLPELVTGAQELWQVGALPRWAGTPLRSFARPLVQRLYEAAIRCLPHLPELASVSDPAHGALGALGRLAATAGLPTLRLNAAFEILATGPRGRSRLRGRALSICLSRGLLDAATLDALLRTHLEASDLHEMAAFLEGLLVKSESDRLVEQDRLWRAVDAWLRDAPPEAFARALLPLRRALAGWPPSAREAILAHVGTRVPSGAAGPTPIPLDPRASEALERALERLDGLEL